MAAKTGRKPASRASAPTPRRAAPLQAPEQLAEYRQKRDFTATKEPAGGKAKRGPGRLRFVIQKHAASHLHFDLRLELDGVMRSWAVPKGPSLDPAVKRLAMEVEDHPIEYNSFEGTIPQGEYGGGTVMLWDRGTYTADTAEGGDDATAVRKGLDRGDLKISFQGERLAGSFAIVRMKFARGSSAKPQWLLIKHRDSHATAEGDIVAENVTSVTTGKTMDQIASGTTRAPSRAKADAVKLPSSLEPMYASVGAAVPGIGWTFEPKYDGIRVLAFATASAVRLVTRNGKDKSLQFPEIVEALRKISAATRRDIVLDGEIVALINGTPARFQELQGRMHVKEPAMIERHTATSPAAFIAFDMVMDGGNVLLHDPWAERRSLLVKRLGKRVNSVIRLTESAEGDGRAMLELARRQGWEGIIAKRIDSVYESGVRSRAWLKLKIEFRQEFVIGGFTEPRNTRQHIGALLLGYFDRGRFIYVGHTGGGFTAAGLAAMRKKLAPLELSKSPFTEVPRTNEKAHWVEPKIVVEVKFNEWTTDGKLRQPIFLGIRDDKAAREVTRENSSVQKGTSEAKGTTPKRLSGARKRILELKGAKPPARKSASTSALLDHLTEAEEQGGDAVVSPGKGIEIQVTNLRKMFFPKPKLTKGDLMRYYVQVAPLILPVVAERPLVLRRFPNGVAGEAFFQQNAAEGTPDGVRVERIQTEGGSSNRRLVGGDLATLLYTTQLGSISVDPWHSRIQSLEFADYTILDLDPGPRATFKRVVQVAHWVKEAMDAFGLSGAIKTSGSTGLHIFIPLPPKTPNAAATLVAQLIATRVAEAHPKIATIERSVKARGATTVYVDYLQNIIGKTVAAAYAVRARPGATVSTPLSWDELNDDLDPQEFTLETAPARFARVGDLWTPAMKKKNSLRALT